MCWMQLMGLWREAGLNVLLKPGDTFALIFYDARVERELAN